MFGRKMWLIHDHVLGPASYNIEDVRYKSFSVIIGTQKT